MSVNLPQELLIDILLKLPPKLLIQFRCVCKSWKSLISSPYFVSLQTQQAMISRAKSIKERDRMILRKLRYSTAQDHSEIFSVHVDDGHFTLFEDMKIEDPNFQGKVRYYNRIVCACNGVFCLSDDFLSSVMLWNPVIKRKVILPWSRGNEPLLFALGFGFDARNNDYKVVKFACARKGDVVVPPEAEVYALSTGNWRKINGNIPRDCIVEHLWPQVFVHGNVHWTAYRKQTGAAEHDDRVENLIVAFDIEHEVFGEMPLPDTLKNEAPLRLNITAFEQSLAVVHCHQHGLGLESFSVWVMKNYRDKESWNKLHVPEPGIWSSYTCGANGGALFASRNGGLHLYRPVTWQRRSMSSKTLKKYYSGPYVESLALLSEGTEAE